LPRAPRLRTPPPYSEGLQCCHVSHVFRPCLPAQEGSGARICPMAPNPTSLLGRAPMLPHVSWIQTLPPCSGRLQCCHVSCGSRPYLPTQEGSGATTCPVAPVPASLLGRTLMLACVMWPLEGHNLRNKEKLSWLTYAAWLTCFQGVPACFRDA
jgi:hypothetical protein